MSDEWVLLVWIAISVLVLTLISIRNVWYDKKHGMKHTLTDRGLISEWDFRSPLTRLKLLKLFIQGEFDTEKRNKYIRQYNRLKKSLKDAGYDVSDFPDYKIK